MKYRLYIDEVGNPDLKSSENPNHRFLSITGVIFELDYIKKLVFLELESLKQNFFESHPDEPIILHLKEIVNAKHPFEALRDDKIRKKFDETLLSLFENFEYTVITVCLDKKIHKETYTTWRYDPYHYCLAIILERHLFFLEGKKEVGDIMAESRGGKEDRRLKESYTRLWEKGTDFLSPERFQKSFTSRQLKVKPKFNNISGLQIADLLAHPSRNEILNEHNFLERPMAPFASKIINILSKKYYQEEGKIFGKKFL